MSFEGEAELMRVDFRANLGRFENCFLAFAAARPPSPAGTHPAPPAAPLEGIRSIDATAPSPPEAEQSSTRERES